MPRGLLVDDVWGPGQGDFRQGTMSSPASLAFEIARGEIISRARHASVVRRFGGPLRDVTAVSHETHWAYGPLHLPAPSCPR